MVYSCCIYLFDLHGKMNAARKTDTTLMHCMSSLIDAKLADVHMKLERNLELLENTLHVLQNVLEVKNADCVID